jgi:ribonuclease D
MRTAIQQLESLNYMRIVRDRSASGQFIQSRWIVSDEPIVDWAPHLENPRVEEPVLDQPVQGDQGATNTGFKETLDSSKTTTTGPEDTPPDTDESPALIMDEGMKSAGCGCAKSYHSNPKDAGSMHGSLHLRSTRCFGRSPRMQAPKQHPEDCPPIPCLLLRRAREGKFSLSAGSELRRDLRQIIRRQRAVEAAAEPAQTIETDRPAVDRAQARERLQQMRDELARKSHTSAMPRGTA